ncbi:transposase [Pseudalkalibacillus salsuginis]|uniref:transposase n=1 Tax=Pseudalkalibacillus salsuginis TaxID=2910972 RepID=UPI001F27D8D2|nr:transposase [Pseudalkalibacillus salsuginis]MCF6410965.1 transposase [Pseudalkalibacillus salsuginis]
MPRKPRVWYPGAEYHITSRGNRKTPLFYDNQDRHKYMKILGEAQSEFTFDLYSYCLMTNHIHLQLKTHFSAAQQIMRKIHHRYALFFNKKYEFVGHVFQGRYGAKLIQSPNYQMDVSKYIHLNPVKADLAATPGAYEWSSYRTYVDFHRLPYVNPYPVLSHFPYPQNIEYKKFAENDPTASITGDNLEKTLKSAL